MCGIAGYVYDRNKPGDKALLARMCDAMRHRGPDDFGVYFDEGAALGHRRLSIIDLSHAGRQPMTNEDGSLWLVYNGEIYNFLELAADLKKAGHVFRSQTDSEVILHLYEEKGADCVDSLNGMFAFAIWDKTNRTLFAARDRLGIKPFFFRKSDSHFIFASEIKAILQDYALSREPDLCAVADYLFCGMPLSGKTMFKDIHELPPGYRLTYKDVRLTIGQYWDVSYDYDASRAEKGLLQDLVWLLEDAVRIHCRSDAPLGCHLSGGMDSSTVTCLASRYRDALKTFSIKFDGNGYFDETPYAKSVANHINAHYIESIPRDEDLAKRFPFLIYHNEAPMQNIGAFAYYTVSELASKHVKVSLTGHGGDEIFAGYPAQFQAAYGKTDMFVLPTRPNQRQFTLSKVINAFSKYGLRETAKRAAGRLKPQSLSFEDLWTALHCGYLPQEHPLIHPAFLRSLQDYSPKEEYLRALKEAPTKAPLDRCLYHDLKVYLPGLLQMEDRVSMAVSIESRVPLLDYRIVELMATVLPEHKIGDFEPKHLLRNAARRIVPENVRERKDKSPFPVPVYKWLTDGLSGMVHSLLSSSAFRSREIIDPKTLAGAKADPEALWSMINLELWFRIYIDQDLDPASFEV